MEEYVTSRQNRLFVHLKKLQTSRAYREKTRQFCGDGTKLLEEAVQWYPGLHTVIACEALALPALPACVRVVRVPERLMQSLSTMRSPQGTIFLCHMPEPTPLDIRPGSLILDGIQDPGNLGTILRTADALDVPVVLTDGCADPYSEKTVRASMGAVLRTQPGQANAEKIIVYCKAHSIPIATAALSERAVDLREAALKDCTVVIGSEGQGVRRQFLDESDSLVIIPMHKHCESLNAAIAATIVMWEMRRIDFT